MRRNKYGAKKVERAGRSFASKLEASGFDMLTLREKAGEIRDIRQQVKVYLTLARILYICDYAYTDVGTGVDEYMEMKGMETASWRIKRKLWEFYGPGLLAVYKGDYRSPRLGEIIVPARKYEEHSIDNHTEHW